MGVSKVNLGGETLVDLTEDTVTPNSLLSGYSAHNKAGELIEGLAVVPTKISELENDAGYKTTDNNTTYALSKSGATITLTGSDGSKTSVTDANTTYGVVTTSANGLMSSRDKSKLDGIASGANKTSITNSLTATVAGTALDAVQGKTLNDKGAQMSVYKGDDGNLHFRDWSGADTVIPFSSGLTIKGTIYADVRQSGQWMNRSSRSFTLTIQNGQTNISVESGDGVIAGMTALDFIRARFVISSVSID